MNKLLAIPLFFIIMMSLLGLVNDINYTFTGATEYEERQVWNETSFQWETREMPVQEEPFTLVGMDGAMVVLVAAIAIAMLLGISILGSGVSEYTQSLTLHVAVYGGIWGVFSALSYTMLISLAIFGAFIWICFTVMYVLGFVQEMGAKG